MSIAQKSIVKEQQMQKHNFDRGANDNQLKNGDLCMLKAEPRFCLDMHRQYKNPFHIHSLSTTNVVIKPTHDRNGELINVSRQRLSKTLVHYWKRGKHWLGHSGKLKHHWKIKRP